MQRKTPDMYLAFGMKSETYDGFKWNNPVIVTKFNHMYERDCEDIIVIDCDQKEKAPEGACVRIETDKGYHYILPFDGKWSPNPSWSDKLFGRNSSYLDALFNHPLQDKKYRDITLNTRKSWVEYTHNKNILKVKPFKKYGEIRRAEAMNHDWLLYADKWNYLATYAEYLLSGQEVPLSFKDRMSGII